MASGWVAFHDLFVGIKWKEYCLSMVKSQKISLSLSCSYWSTRVPSRIWLPENDTQHHHFPNFTESSPSELSSLPLQTLFFPPWVAISYTSGALYFQVQSIFSFFYTNTCITFSLHLLTPLVSFFFIFLFFSRHGFSVHPCLSWNLLCRLAWPGFQRSAWLCHLGSGIKRAFHHHPACSSCFLLITSVFASCPGLTLGLDWPWFHVK